LKKDHNIDIDKRKIEVKEGIKGLGDYDAVIKVHPEITSKIKVHIIAG
jgi:large subunit ribosomal protein L9